VSDYRMGGVSHTDFGPAYTARSIDSTAGLGYGAERGGTDDANSIPHR
jgi:hypothetical protein